MKYLVLWSGTIHGLIARGSIVKNRFGQFAIAYGQFKKELES